MWSVNLLKLKIEKFDGNIWRNAYIDFTTSGRWKTIRKGTRCDLYIEIVGQKDISKWYQRTNIQPVNRWVVEYSFIEVKTETCVETINECN